MHKELQKREYLFYFCNYSLLPEGVEKINKIIIVHEPIKTVSYLGLYETVRMR
jgi:hypothetical protein